MRFRRFTGLTTAAVTVTVTATLAQLVLPGPMAWAALTATTGASFSTTFVRAGPTTAQATFVVPAFHCPVTSAASASPGAGLTVMRGGAANSVVASVSMDCQSGVPSTQVNVVVTGGPETYPYGEARANEVQPGNKVTVEVSATASRSTATVRDVTTNKNFEAVGAGGKAYLISAEVDTAGTATTTWPTPSFGQITFSPVLFDGKKMGASPLRVTNLVQDGKPEVTLKLIPGAGPFPTHSSDSFTAVYQAP